MIPRKFLSMKIEIPCSEKIEKWTRNQRYGKLTKRNLAIEIARERRTANDVPRYLPILARLSRRRLNVGIIKLILAKPRTRSSIQKG